jgi:hypothetical protein
MSEVRIVQNLLSPVDDEQSLACQPMRRAADKRWAITAQFQNEYDGTLHHDIYSSTLIPCKQPFDLLENRVQ